MNIKYRIIFIIMIFLMISPVFSQEEAEILKSIYDRASSYDQQYAILSTVIDRRDPGLEDFLLYAITEHQMSKETVKGFNQQYKYERLLTLMMEELGDMKTTRAAGELIRAFREADNAYVKSDAIIALGKVDAQDYAEELSLYLYKLNNGGVTIPDKQQRETAVLSLIAALENLENEHGFEPIFYVYIGNYAREIRERAYQSLVRMLPDPSTLILKIIANEKDQEIIYQALIIEDNSNAPDAGMEKVATEALRQSMTAQPEDAREKSYQSQIRLLSAGMLKRVHFTSNEAVTYLSKILDEYIKYRTYTTDEILAILSTMSENVSDPNARALTDFLEYQTDQREAGRSVEDLRIIKATIIALGETGNSIGREELMRASYSPDWEPSVQEEARKALEKL